jgi:ADP-ribose pyrophosphatase
VTRHEPVGGFRSEPLRDVYRWATWTLVQGDFVGPRGETFTRTFVSSPGAVAVVALLDDSADPGIVLVRQYRPALHRMTIELPAGMRDQEGEDGATTAARELREEAGYEAASMERLGSHMSAPGIANSTVELFLARNLRVVDVAPHGPEEDHMTILRPRLSEVLAMIDAGDIDDSKTIIGSLLAWRRLSI